MDEGVRIACITILYCGMLIVISASNNAVIALLAISLIVISSNYSMIQ